MRLTLYSSFVAVNRFSLPLPCSLLFYSFVAVAIYIVSLPLPLFTFGDDFHIKKNYSLCGRRPRWSWIWNKNSVARSSDLSRNIVVWKGRLRLFLVRSDSRYIAIFYSAEKTQIYGAFFSILLKNILKILLN